MAVINPPERNLAKRTSVHCVKPSDELIIILFILGSRLEHHTWMQGELQKLEERNSQKMATLENLEEKISTLEKGNLLRGIDNYSGAALKAVKTAFDNQF